jgi:hypothetical protein
MTNGTSRVSEESDTGTFLTGTSQLALTKTGEVEIAGHRYATPERLAKMLGVTVRTLARWNASRIGPPKISIGKTVLFELAKLPDWLASREIPPTRNTRH